MRSVIFILLFTLAAGSLHAQSRGERFKARVDSTLAMRYYKVSYDTSYISRPNYKLTLKARLNMSGNGFYTRSKENGVTSTSDLKTSNKTTISVSASYLGLSAGISINPGSWSGRNKDYEFNLNYYSNRFSVDASYQDSKTLAGDVDSGDDSYHLDRGILEMKVLNVAAYYTFNYKRFSYPAAFNQTYIQRKSVGSWLAGISYQGGSIKTADSAPEDIPRMRLYVGHVGIGGGYGYNFVVGKWLFHLSALPTFVIYNRNNYTVDGERVKSKHIYWNMIFNERIAIVRQFSSKYFACASVVMNNSIFSDDIVVINQNKWRARLSFGMRL